MAANGGGDRKPNEMVIFNWLIISKLWIKCVIFLKKQNNLNKTKSEKKNDEPKVSAEKQIQEYKRIRERHMSAIREKMNKIIAMCDTVIQQKRLKC